MVRKKSKMFPIVDSHLHIWDPGYLNYPWLDEFPPLDKPFLLEDYKEACGMVNVHKMVFLQCECIPEEFVKEVRWVTHLSLEDTRIQGIVAGASLEKGEGIRPLLEELSANALVKGVRRLIQGEGIEFCLQPNFVNGVRILEDYNFSFDICINHRQLSNVIKLVRQCPNVRFVLDHIGKPDIRNRVLEPWKKELKSLSELANVWCKISGLVTEADLQSWTREDLKPYISHVIECFGFDRVMYGGDWPVATLATDYPRWVDALEWAVRGCSEKELKKLFHDNAVAFYRL